MSAAEAYRRLAASQKSSRGAPLYSLLINRPLGRLFASAAYPLGLTPNQVTMVSAAFTFASIAVLCVAPPTIGATVIIVLCLVVGYALDSADGQLARLRGGGSLSGEWLDHIIDSAKIASLHTAVAIMAYRHFDAPPWWLLVPLAFGVVSVVHFFGMLLTELLLRTKPGADGPKGEGSMLMSAAKLPTDYGVLCLSFALLPWTTGFMVVYTVLAAATAAYTALVVIVWYRRLTKADRP